MSIIIAVPEPNSPHRHQGRCNSIKILLAVNHVLNELFKRAGVLIEINFADTLNRV
jgi:hypothetical protein